MVQTSEEAFRPPKLDVANPQSQPPTSDNLRHVEVYMSLIWTK